MIRTFKGRRGVFQPGQQIIIKKPSVQALNNLSIAAALSANSATNPTTSSASASSVQAQQISAQKQAAANASLQVLLQKEAAANSKQAVTQEIKQVQQTNVQKAVTPSIVNTGRFSRGGPIAADSKRAVTGKKISEYKAEEAASKAAAEAAKSISVLKTAQMNNALIGGSAQSAAESYYDVDANLNSAYKEAIAQGLKVNAPTVYGKTLKTESAAKAAQQSYVDYLDKQYTAYNAAAAAAQPVTVYDDLRRSQSISQSQLAQMEKAQQNRKSSGTYTVLPEEVANSNANWWINSNGLYEWAPVTAGDKAHLEQINAQRKRLGQSLRTTLTCGASPSAEYSQQWYSTGGNRTQVARNIKLAALKASSSVNNSASAKSNTAQTQKATVISASETAKKQAAAQAQRKVAAEQAAAEAKKAETIAAQAKAEVSAKAKQLTAARAEVKKAVSTADKAAAQKNVKTLEKAAETAKTASKAADNHAKSTASLATATQKAANSSAKKTPAVTDAVKKAEAKVEKTATAAQKAGVQDHTGQILLKDGTWISTVQK